FGFAGTEQRPKPAEMLGTAVLFINAANAPLAAEHAVVHVPFVKAGTEPGGTHLESHSEFLFASFERHDDLLAGPQVFELNDAVGILRFQEPRSLQGEVLPVAIPTGDAVFGDLVPRPLWDLSPHRPQSSSASRFTAGASGFLDLSQSCERP